MALVEGKWVSQHSLLIMLLSFVVGIIYWLNVDKCMHLVNDGTRSNLIRFYYGALLSRSLDISALNVIISI